MKRLAGKFARALLGLVLLLGAYVGLFSFAGAFVKYPLWSSPSAPGPQIRGAYHVHTTRSDGRATPEQIALFARDAGLQFVVLTDHNLEAPQPPRFVEGVLLIDAVELSTGQGHVTALGLSRPLTADERKTAAIDVARSLGAATFPAHPEQKKNPWRDWDAGARAEGLELYSADSMFRDAQREPFSRFLPAVGAFLTNPRHGMLLVVRAQDEAHQRLLGLAASEPKVALCAHDAHGYPPYDAEFATLALYLSDEALPADPLSASTRVLERLRSGAAYCAFHALGPSEGFSLRGLDERRRAKVGQKVEVTLPDGAPTGARIIAFGQSASVEGRTLTLLRPGPVLVEVWVPAPGRFFGTEERPWLVASPFLVEP